MLHARKRRDLLSLNTEMSVPPLHSHSTQTNSRNTNTLEFEYDIQAIGTHFLLPHGYAPISNRLLLLLWNMQSCR